MYICHMVIIVLNHCICIWWDFELRKMYVTRGWNYYECKIEEKKKKEKFKK